MANCRLCSSDNDKQVKDADHNSIEAETVLINIGKLPHKHNTPAPKGGGPGKGGASRVRGGKSSQREYVASPVADALGTGDEATFVSARTMCPCCRSCGAPRSEEGEPEPAGQGDSGIDGRSRKGLGERRQELPRFEGFREREDPIQRARRLSSGSQGSITVVTGEHRISINTISMGGEGGNSSRLEAGHSKGKGQRPWGN